jgi:hypothetical protein
MSIRKTSFTYDTVHFAFMVKHPKVHVNLLMNTVDIPYK